MKTQSKAKAKPEKESVMKYGLNRGSAEASGPTLTIETKDEPEMKYGLNRGSVETSGTHSDEKHIITEREEHIRLRPNSIARERGRERSVLPRKRASSRSVTGKGRSYVYDQRNAYTRCKRSTWL